MLTKILLGSNLFHGVKGTKKKAKRQTKRKIIWLFAHLSVPLRRSYDYMQPAQSLPCHYKVIAVGCDYDL